MRGIGDASYQAIVIALQSLDDSDDAQQASQSQNGYTQSSSPETATNWQTLFPELTNDTTAVDVLPLSDRTIRNLKRAGVITVSKLVTTPRAKLMAIRTIGQKSIRTIGTILQDYAQYYEKISRLFSDHTAELAWVYGAPLDQISIECLDYSDDQEQRLTAAGVETVVQLIDHAQAQPLDERLRQPLQDYLLWLASQYQENGVWQVSTVPDTNTAVAPPTITLPDLAAQWLSPLSDKERHHLLDAFAIHTNPGKLTTTGADTPNPQQQNEAFTIRILNTLRDDYAQRGELLWLPLLSRLHRVLTDNGGLLTKNELISWLHQQSEIEIETVLPFNLITLLSRVDSTIHVGTNPPILLNGVFKVVDVSIIQDSISDCLETAEHPLTPSEVIDAVSQSRPYHRIRIEKQVDPQPFLAACLRHHPDLQQTDDGRYQLIKPKAHIRDHIIAALEKSGRPLHYKEITRYINNHHLSPQPLKSSRVYTQLHHQHDYFTRVGRGIFGLKDWNLPDDGNLKNVIVRIMEEANQPLSLEAIYQRVLKTWHVKETSIYAILKRNDRFVATHTGIYGLREWQQTETAVGQDQ